MADFPDDIFTPREVANREGVSYDAEKTKVFFAEDYNRLADEVVAIEEALGVDLENMALDGWHPFLVSLVYVSANSFKVTGVDLTAFFSRGLKIKLVNDGVTKYFSVVSSTFSTDTTVTITGGSDYSLASGTITVPSYSYSDCPLGFPTYFNYSPNYGGSGSMTYTSVSAEIAAFKISGGVCTVFFQLNGTTGGSADVYLYADLPVTPLADQGTGAYLYDTGVKSGVADMRTNTTVRFYKYDFSNWGLGANKYIRFSGSFLF